MAFRRRLLEVGLNYCCDCRQRKQLKFFSRNIRTSTGYQSVCRRLLRNPLSAQQGEESRMKELENYKVVTQTNGGLPWNHICEPQRNNRNRYRAYCGAEFLYVDYDSEEFVRNPIQIARTCQACTKALTQAGFSLTPVLPGWREKPWNI